MIFPKNPPNIWLLVNHTKPTNTVLKLMSFNSNNYKPVSGQLQNNSVNGAMLIINEPCDYTSNIIQISANYLTPIPLKSSENHRFSDLEENRCKSIR